MNTNKQLCALKLNLAKEAIQRAEEALQLDDWQVVMDRTDDATSVSDEANDIARKAVFGEVSDG